MLFTTSTRVVRNTMRRIIAFLRSLFTRHIAAVEVPPTPTPTPKRKLTDKERRREKLRQMLRRADGGGKHYGSKRAVSNHRGTGAGKRSGRQ
jgi:hypothetical protein